MGLTRARVGESFYREKGGQMAFIPCAYGREDSCPWRSGWMVIEATGKPEPCRATAPAECFPS